MASLSTDGALGSIPDWFQPVQIAREMGVPPWDMAGVPDTAGHPAWLAWSTAMVNAVNEARAARAKRGQGKTAAGKTRHFGGAPTAGGGG